MRGRVGQPAAPRHGDGGVPQRSRRTASACRLSLAPRSFVVTWLQGVWHPGDSRELRQDQHRVSSGADAGACGGEPPSRLFCFVGTPSGPAPIRRIQLPAAEWPSLPLRPLASRRGQRSSRRSGRRLRCMRCRTHGGMLKSCASLRTCRHAAVCCGCGCELQLCFVAMKENSLPLELSWHERRLCCADRTQV